MAITTEMIKELRQATGAGVLEAKKALENANGDFDKAVDALREKGLARAAKKARRRHAGAELRNRLCGSQRGIPNLSP